MTDAIETIKAKIETLEKERATLTQRIQQHQQALNQLQVQLIGAERSQQEFTTLLSELENNDEQVPTP
jgi:prefoldin subunit 5